MNLKEAMIAVMTNQYKKDAKEAHQIVEAAGYTITKDNGHYYIRNEKTHRYCWMIDSGMYRRGHRWVFEWGSMSYGSKAFYIGGDYRAQTVEQIPFDFVTMLNKPYNHAAYTSAYTDVWNKSVAKERYNNISIQKRVIQNKKEEIDSCLKSMAALQHKLISLTEDKCKYEVELNKYRQEYGLKEARS